MKTIVVTNQAELDALPDSFEEYTRIEIRAKKETVIVRMARENSSVVARGNSSVVARGNSSVVAWENSSVEAWGNSSVVAWGNSSVVAWENSSVVARGNSSVEAWGNSSVVAWENSSVEAWGNSSVVARENSSVVARGNSSVVAWGNSSVVAWENSSVEAWGNSSVVAFHYSMLAVFSAYVTIKALRDFAICRLMPEAHELKPEKVAETALMVKSPELSKVTHTKESFLEYYGLAPDADGRIQLWKSVNPKTGCDFQTGKIKYEGIVECPDWNPDPTIQCGQGLHLSATRGDALSYHSGRLVRCKVNIDDFVVFAEDITKVRCRKVEVIS